MRIHRDVKSKRYIGGLHGSVRSAFLRIGLTEYSPCEGVLVRTPHMVNGCGYSLMHSWARWQSDPIRDSSGCIRRLVTLCVALRTHHVRWHAAPESVGHGSKSINGERCG